jgi:hypothetical protein
MHIRNVGNVGHLLPTFADHSDLAFEAAFSQDGRLLPSGTSGGVYLWPLAPAGVPAPNRAIGAATGKFATHSAPNDLPTRQDPV